MLTKIIKSKIFYGILILGFLWFTGFLLFIYHIENLSADKDIHSDVIVVLTGDKGRISAAAQILQQETDALLFISGVGGGAALEALSGTKTLSNEQKQFISIGRKALNTRQNALETAEFIKDKPNIKTILLVTSYYHLPRSLVEFKRTIPDNINIKTYPLKSDTNERHLGMKYKLLLKEYNKFILASMRAFIFGLF